ncbi:aminotransferase-like domain-containing protein [Burkholderia sp. PAMC 26561]|uniref:aminotransferase-like domain-containing protein n=1 Tax=Burkholderia sp. PAMC 26561 TaxID=1795043 RepID=UPI001F2B6F35|nr:PLP-dependent aminotransferase family protein [Burkholderia sp. PAMC 26561]
MPESAPQGTIEFTDGVPDTRVIEFNAISAAFRLALIESARGNQMGYADPRGFLALRRQIASMLRHERGLNADENTLCVVRGSQMGIFLAARILVRPGDVVAMETLTYPAARDAFRSCGATVVGIEQDEHGLIPASLEKLCRRHRIKAIYLTPHHQFPTTVTLTADRRLRLLTLAEQFGFVIVEDDYDHEFHFTGSPMLPMASIDRFGKVIYIGSLSKVLAPGLRIGYIVAPASIINRIAYEVTLIDRQGNTVTERAAAALMDNGELKRHIRRALKIYQARRDFLMQLVAERLGQIASFQPPMAASHFGCNWTVALTWVGSNAMRSKSDCNIWPANDFTTSQDQFTL